jgi:hypothetical protein
MQVGEVDVWKPEEDGKRSACYGRSFGGIRWNPYQFRRFIGKQLEHRLFLWHKMMEQNSECGMESDIIDFVATVKIRKLYHCCIARELPCSGACKDFLRYFIQRNWTWSGSVSFKEFREKAISVASHESTMLHNEVQDILNSVNDLVELFKGGEHAMLIGYDFITMDTGDFYCKYQFEEEKINRLAQAGGRIYEERRQFFDEEDAMFGYVKAAAFYHARARLIATHGESLKQEVLAKSDAEILGMNREKLTKYLMALAEKLASDGAAAVIGNRRMSSREMFNSGAHVTSRLSLF